MDGSFCNQVLAQMLLFKEKFAELEDLKKEIYVKALPKNLDEEVASLMVEGFNGVLTKLTKQQKEYINYIPANGFKDHNYKY